MHTLFAISILAFLILFTAGVAIVRHIRIGRSVASPQTRRDFAQHLLLATEDPPTPNAVTHRLRSLPSQTIHEITANKSWNHPTETILLRPDPTAQLSFHQETIGPVEGRRKSPQSAHYNSPERLDWAYFNKDLGDLTDPYQTPRLQANSRNNATSPKRP
jgi:hypothetical protein